MKKSIIYYGPVGNLAKGIKIGGAESGCRRTVQLLKKMGYEVRVIEKPNRRSKLKIGKVSLFISMLFIWFRVFGNLLKEKKSILHIAGFYLDLAYHEVLLVQTAKILNRKVVYEIKNGDMVISYNEGSFLYKKTLLSILKNSDLILSQGEVYVKFIKDKLGKRSVYYPNYIMSDFLAQIKEKGRKEDKSPGLIFFGRVIPSKNIEIVIDTCHILKQSYGIKSRLNIIGAYDIDYYSKLCAKIKEYELEGYVLFHGRLDLEEMLPILMSSHYFLFPSSEMREGHSNSMTEAMACGVVPIASKAGFNENVLGISDLIVGELSPTSYASKIADIHKNEKWSWFSDYVRERVEHNFVEDKVLERLSDAYKKLYF